MAFVTGSVLVRIVVGSSAPVATSPTSLGMNLRWLALPPLTVRLRCCTTPIGAVIACGGKTPMTPMTPAFLTHCADHTRDCGGALPGTQVSPFGFVSGATWFNSSPYSPPATSPTGPDCGLSA